MVERPVIALIPAAGQGTRLGAAVPKAFVELEGRSLLARSFDAMVRSGVVDEVRVIISPDMEDAARGIVNSAQQAAPHVPISLVHGGAERADSVWEGLKSIEHEQAIVLVHDAARALTPPEMICRVVDSVRQGNSAVIPVLPVADTIKQVRAHGDLDIVVATPDRASLRAVQTPQGCDLQALRRANEDYLAQGPDFVATDDASLMEWHGHQVVVVEGDHRAFKITTPMDLVLAQALLDGKDSL